MILPDGFYQAIVRDLPVAVIVVDRDYKIMEINNAALRLVDRRREEALAQPCSEIMGSNRCGSCCPFRQIINESKGSVSQEAVIITEKGDNIPTNITVVPLRDEAGEIIAGIELIYDVSENKKLEAHKKKLISLFAHDLQAPITISAGFLNRLLRRRAGELNEKQAGYLELIETQINRLNNYIQSFLNISRLETGQFELNLEPVDLSRTLQSVTKEFMGQAIDKEIELLLEVDNGLPVAHVDPLQFTRVISNLLDNAIKFSDKDQVIKVVARMDDSRIIVEVHDQGPGIAPHEQEHIFESFYRIQEKAGKVRGSGLGLTTVKAIIEAHGGAVEVRSEEGKGSCFIVSFPSVPLCGCPGDDEQNKEK
ncbi:MAG: PAS domain-containing sensor histidine kinase [Desulfobulbaceae bacterium]|nr:PAS domain-containing sensor histidine kinase [Desulfobulbaceae bacterium]